MEHGVERSLLLVHAHPDDESIGTGATMAKYAAEGARVTLVTCTLGELGEIIPPDLRHLLPDELGQHRIVELDRACAALGVTDHRFLGGEGRYRDSGMMGLPDNDDPRCFWQANVEEAADALAKVIEEVAADAIVTYDANGFYGHPDHIQAHRVTRRAHELTGQAAKLYATAMPRSVLATRRRASRGLLVHANYGLVGRRAGRPGHHGDRRDRVPGRQAGGDARPRDADHRGRRLLRALQRDRRSGSSRTEYYTSSRARAVTTETADERDLFAR